MDIETDTGVNNRSALQSTYPLRHDNTNEAFAHESVFSKHRDSKYNNVEPSYISQFNEQDMYLAIGPEDTGPKSQDQQLEELREYFKKKIVNAYNSIYLESVDPDYRSDHNLTEAERMIRKIIIR